MIRSETPPRGAADAAVKRRILAFLTLGGVLYYASYLSRFPFNFGDEGYLLYVANALGHGQVPYRDVRLFAYPPGLFYLFTPLVRWQSHEILLARCLMLVGLVVKVGLLYLCARRFTSQAVALGVALAMLLIPGPWHKFYVGLLALWILWAVVSYFDRPGRRTAWGLGLAVGVATLFRMDVALVGVGLLFAAGWLRLRQLRSRGHALAWDEWLGAALVAVAVTAPLQLLLWRQGVLSDHFRQWLGFAGLVVRRSNSPIRLPPPEPEALLRFDASGANAWMYYVCLAIVLGYALKYLRLRADWVRAPSPSSMSWALPGAVGLWALGGVPQFALERPDESHLAQYAAVVLLPAALLVERVATGRRRRWRRLVHVGAALMAGLFVIKYLVFAERGGGEIVLRRPAHWVTLSNGFTYPAHHTEPLRPLLNRIVEESEPHQRIAALPFLPGAALATRRRLMGREVYLVPHSMTGPEVTTSYVEALTSGPPRFVLYLPTQSFNKQLDGRLDAYAPAITRHLLQHFRIVEERRRFLLMEPIPLPESLAASP